jgi:hypothetical protein
VVSEKKIDHQTLTKSSHGCLIAPAQLHMSKGNLELATKSQSKNKLIKSAAGQTGTSQLNEQAAS